MIESLLVANRGEIACRIFRTARRLGIRTIAVFSDADAAAQHVREADEAVWIGPAAPRESYLDVTRILDAARGAQAQAIHPGYGFLSENSQFAQACTGAGLLFVGPPAAAIAAMGSKIVAKARLRAAGVPVLPGYEGTQQDLGHLHGEALRLGLPLIIKPAAGGGGKGMQIVRDAEQIAQALAAARRLAESGFGDGSLLLERFLPAPRHIEVQIFADAHGNFVHLGERDCSIQRRHQKLIEEAPAPGLQDELRARLRAAALVVARAIGYVSAGTVEFLFDGREFYFMEMNTRLQVEHTVTEAVTGLDLVEWQLRVAAGERLPMEQADIRFDGHAMEARVCAEDPERDFLPSAGQLRLMQWPQGEAVRVDAGFATGDAVPESYDSLLGKVIAWAPSRSEAATRLAGALERTYCAGVHTNERWLARIVRAPQFLTARHSIAFLQEHIADFRDPSAAEPRAIALAALIAHAGEHGPHASAIPSRPGARLPIPASSHDCASPWNARDGFIPNLPAHVGFTLASCGQRCPVDIEFGRTAAAAIQIRTDGAAVPLRIEVTHPSQSADFISATLDRVRWRARYFADGSHIHIWVPSGHYDFILEDPRAIEFTASASHGGLTTPLPGVVAAVNVEPGQTVAMGEVLMVIEAMKMEHTITAPYAGTVQAIHFARGDRVPEGSELLELAAASTALD
ncbi:MAG: acetyl/propionyl/methylcrotonyl-CoA carboxylase subunit alpha [Steroidobacteraceae bacterium]